MELSRTRQLYWLLSVALIVVLASVVNVYTSGNVRYSLHSPAHPARPYRFPGGGHKLLPGYRLVALYGTPDQPSLGVLGEQPPEATVARVKALAAQYQPYSRQRILPTLEIIATIASAYPTVNGDYSQQQDIQLLRPWIVAARDAGVYVVLDFQPGRSDFMHQVTAYTPLLEEPNVGLALDPEWRLAPTQLPLRQIGSVDVTEVNDVASWLNDLVVAKKLPQKLFLVHQFQLQMIRNRTQLNTSYGNLAYMLQMDGQGGQPDKLATWQGVVAALPPGVVMGWKNFYHQDHPMLTPEQTMNLTPQPSYISYQ